MIMTVNYKLNKDTKIAVALSGGVDSAVSAALLQKQGFHVEGIFMKNWSGDNFGIQADCPWEQDQKDAEAVCKALNIPFRSLNLEKEYREKVVEYFFAEFGAGRTPNPDVMCNKEIKFGIFLEKAKELGFDMIAAGHYVQRQWNEQDQLFELHRGVDPNKDQSYFLNAITQEQLAKAIFPIGHLQKPEVRKLAEEFNLPVAEKKDSQGICFIGEINVKEFLRKNLEIHQGKIIDIDKEEVVGEHDGIEFYTIGQREGLEIGGAPKPYYVVGKRKQENELLVAMGRKNKHLFKTEVKFSDANWISDFPKTKEISAAIRYRQAPGAGQLDLETNTFKFSEPQRAIAPGQSIVFYTDSKCLGGAIIN